MGRRKKEFVLEEFDWTPLDLFRELRRYVVAQEQALMVVSTGISRHYNRLRLYAIEGKIDEPNVRRNKNTFLLAGPSGSGKTTIIEHATKLIGVPYTIIDSNAFSEAGYVGREVDDIPRLLLKETRGNVELAQYGMIFIDEIDKKAEGKEAGIDVSRSGVINALLKLVEGADVPYKVNKGDDDEETKGFISTENMLFAFAGAFEGLEQLMREDVGVGFGKRESKASLNRNSNLRDGLQKYGFSRQFIGRMRNVVELDELTLDDYMTYLNMPTNAALMTLTEEFRSFGIRTEFTYSAKEAIAKRVVEYNKSANGGARSIMTYIDLLVDELSFHLPSTDCEELIIDGEFLNNPEASIAKLKEKFPEVPRREKPIVIALSDGTKATKSGVVSKVSERSNLTLAIREIPRSVETYSGRLRDYGLEGSDEFFEEISRYGIKKGLKPESIAAEYERIQEDFDDELLAMSKRYKVMFRVTDNYREAIGIPCIGEARVQVKEMLQGMVGKYFEDNKELLKVAQGRKIKLDNKALMSDQYFADLYDRWK